MSNNPHEQLLVRRIHAALQSKAYNIAPGELIAVWPWGSRLWGTHTRNSDHDTVVLHAAPHGIRCGATIAPGIDARIESAVSFIDQLVVVGDITAWFVLLLPHNGATIVDVNVAAFAAFRSKALAACGHRFDVSRVLGDLVETLGKDEARAVKLFDGGDVAKAAKICKHSCRLVKMFQLVCALLLVSDHSKANGNAPPAAAASARPNLPTAAAAVATSAPGASRSSAAFAPNAVLDMSDVTGVEADVVAFFQAVAQRGDDGNVAAIYGALRAMVPR